MLPKFLHRAQPSETMGRWSPPVLKATEQQDGPGCGPDPVPLERYWSRSGACSAWVKPANCECGTCGNRIEVPTVLMMRNRAQPNTLIDLTLLTPIPKREADALSRRGKPVAALPDGTFAKAVCKNGISRVMATLLTQVHEPESLHVLDRFAALTHWGSKEYTCGEEIEGYRQVKGRQKRKKGVDKQSDT